MEFKNNPIVSTLSSDYEKLNRKVPSYRKLAMDFYKILSIEFSSPFFCNDEEREASIKIIEDFIKNSGNPDLLVQKIRELKSVCPEHNPKICTLLKERFWERTYRKSLEITFYYQIKK